MKPIGNRGFPFNVNKGIFELWLFRSSIGVSSNRLLPTVDPFKWDRRVDQHRFQLGERTVSGTATGHRSHHGTACGYAPEGIVLSIPIPISNSKVKFQLLKLEFGI
jgi:hypothetical protein